jgi:nicotinamidase-related amidase
MTDALLIIDMQREMQRRIDAGMDCVNPDAPDLIAALARAYRDHGLPVLHVRHASDDPSAALHPDAPGYPPMPCAEEGEGEAVFVKSTSSAFASTVLDAHLRQTGIRSLAVVGAVAGFCVNSTVRAGSDLGYDMTVVRDAIIGFGLPGANLSARTIFDVTLAHLEADFARVVDSGDLTHALFAGLART